MILSPRDIWQRLETFLGGETAARTWKQPKCPIVDDGIRLWCIYTMENYSAIRRDEILPFATTWMDLEITMLSENSHDITYM